MSDSEQSQHEIRFENLGPGDYDRAKKIFNRARHPGFIGRELFFRAATTGVACVATIDGGDFGVALIAKDKLLALSVVGEGQGKGIGSALMRRLSPRWVSAIADKVSWFERLGYKPYGPPKVGQNGKHATQLMELGEVPTQQGEAIESVKVDLEKKTPKEAEGPPALPESVDDRIGYIADEMRALRWERGKSAKRLAAAWGIPESTIRNYSTEAHRQVMAEINADEAGRETGLALRRVMHDALNDGDRGAVIRAAEVWATLSGAKAPAKQEITGAIANVTLDELDAIRRAAQANECLPSESPNSESEPSS